MCDVPSWYQKGKTVLFVTDKDAKRADIPLQNATGHSAIQQVFGSELRAGGFKQGEGFHKDTPKVILKAIADGKMNALLAVGSIRFQKGNWKIPAPKFGENVTLHTGAKVTAPNLKEVGGSIVMDEKSELTAPVLKKFDMFDGYYPFKLKAPHIKLPA